MFGFSSNTKNGSSSEGPSHRCQNIPSPTAGLRSLISSAGGIPPSHQNNVPVSTAIGSAGAVGGADDIVFPAVNPPELKLESNGPRNSDETRSLAGIWDEFLAADPNRRELCESLGFESSIERMSGGIDDILSTVMESPSSSSRSSNWKSRSYNSRAARRTFLRRNGSALRLRAENFPPLLTSLDESGLQRFVLERITDEDGRLVIAMVKSEQHRVIRTRSADNQTSTKLVILDE